MATDALMSSRLSADAVQALDGAGGGARAHARARRAPRRRAAPARPLAAHEPARLGSRPHRRLRGPVAAHRHGGLELLRPDLAALYDAFETPRAVRGDIEPLEPREARDYLEEVRARTVETIAERGAGDGVICEMVLRHELQHAETMRQTMAIAGPAAGRRARAPTAPRPARERRVDRRRRRARSRWAPAPTASPTTTSARATASTPALRDRAPAGHQRELAALQRGRRLRAPRVVVGARAGRGRRSTTIAQHPAIAAGRPGGARLPRHLVRGRRLRPRARRATAQRGRVGAGGDRGAPLRCGVGRVWEWTPTRASSAIPGFVAHPYREYSEVFFGERLPRPARRLVGDRPARRDPRFRNWDLPQRRQIFAGVRLARDVVSTVAPARGETR